MLSRLLWRIQHGGSSWWFLLKCSLVWCQIPPAWLSGQPFWLWSPWDIFQDVHELTLPPRNVCSLFQKYCKCLKPKKWGGKVKKQKHYLALEWIMKTSRSLVIVKGHQVKWSYLWTRQAGCYRVAPVCRSRMPWNDPKQYETWDSISLLLRLFYEAYQLHRTVRDVTWMSANSYHLCK